MIPMLEAKRQQAGLKAQGRGQSQEKGVFYVAFSPEREDPGNTTVARHNIPKVVGGHDEIATELAATLYEGIFTRAVRVSSTRVAEMTKLLENIYRCVNIALVNELKLLSLRMGVDIWEVIDAAATKPFGFHPFYPGPGLGGHCIPIDPFYLSWKAKEYRLQYALHRAGRRGERGDAGARCAGHGPRAEPAQEGDERLEDPDAGHGLQERHRRPARVAVADGDRAAAGGGRRGALQRSLLPYCGPRPPLQPEHDVYAA